MKTANKFVSLFVLVLIAGCAGGEDTGPAQVRWDRDTCVRCIMAVSDRNYAAQIRGGAGGEKTKPYKFDDFGCAVIWLDQQPWKNDSRTTMWVTDFNNGEWLDMKTAWYVAGHKTPMDYGLGAQSQKTDGAMDFEQAMEHVRQRDQRSRSGQGNEHEGHNH